MMNKTQEDIKKALDNIDAYAKIAEMPHLNCREGAKLIGKSHTWLWNHVCNGDIESQELKTRAKTKIYKIIKISDLRDFIETYVEIYKKPLASVYSE